MESGNFSRETGRMVPLYLGVFILSLATLVIEISLARIFSVTIWHHFAFMIISTALLGFGASGSFLAVFWQPGKWNRYETTSLLCVLYCLTVVAGLVGMAHISLDPFQILEKPFHLVKLVVLYGLLIVPFFLAGLCTSFLLASIPHKAGQIYSFSLSGSGMGCLVSVLTIPILSDAGAIMFAAFSLLIAALMFNGTQSKRRNVQIGCLMLLLGPLVFFSRSFFEYNVAESKSMSAFRQANLKPVITTWNAFSRIDVFGPTNAVYAPGLSVKYQGRSIPRQMMVFIDADANTPITELSGRESCRDFFVHLPSSLAYQIKRHANVCIIGAGGGFDVLTALMTGDPTHITAVEVNGDILDIVRNRLTKFSGDLYRRPDVSLTHDEGRSFIKNHGKLYDIIQISLVDTWAAASMGAYSLAENYLYTVEAFTDFMNRLAPDGILTFTRWLLTPPKECLRLVALACSALEKAGVENPEHNMVLVGSGRIAVLLLKKTQFTRSDVSSIQELCNTLGFFIVYAPGTMRDNLFSRFILSENKQGFYAAYPLNIEPPTDDRPFYFHYYTWDKLRFSKVSHLFSWYKEDVSYLVLLVLLVQATVLSAVFMIAPLQLKRGISPLRNRNWLRVLLYFALLGLGFMFIELTLIQKFILFLGHPVYSFSVVLFCLLTSAGLGSLFSAKVELKNAGTLAWLLAGIAALVLAYSYLLSALSELFLGWCLVFRVVVSIVLLVPLGFLIGMPFPLGVRLANHMNSHLVPWSWAVNGFFSVISSILAVMLAMSFGFSVVLQWAAVSYLLASLAIYRKGRSPS